MYSYPEPYKSDPNGLPSYQVSDYPAAPPPYTPYAPPMDPSVLPPYVPAGIITAQPSATVVTHSSYRDYTRLSILTLIHCFLPLGFVALIYSCKARKALQHGDVLMAERLSRKSFILNMVAIGVGIPLHIAWIIVIIYIRIKYRH